MTAKIANGFSIGKLTNLDWKSVNGYAAEVDQEHGNVFYRDKFVATMFNDKDGGDVLGVSDERITDEQVYTRIAEIDAECERVDGDIESDGGSHGK